MTHYTGFAADSSSDLVSWGLNSDGQTSDGTTTDHGVQYWTVTPGFQFNDFAVGLNHACGIEALGFNKVYCIGYND
jgi:hypothetical protein